MNARWPQEEDDAEDDESPPAPLVIARVRGDEGCVYYVNGKMFMRLEKARVYARKIVKPGQRIEVRG